VSENKELNRDTSREVDNKWSTREAVNIFDSKLYYKVVISSREKYNSSSLW